MRNANYITTLSWMRNLKVNLVEKTVFAIIYGFSQDEESNYHGSRSYLAEWCECSTKTIDRALAHLCELGYIHKREVYVAGVKFCRYSVDVPTVDKLSIVGTNTEKGMDKLSVGIDKMSHNIIVNNADTIVSANSDNARARTFDFKKALMDLGVTEQTACDWMAVRKNNKATNTETAFKALRNQIEKICKRHGVTAEQVVAFAASKDWKGINAEWDAVKNIKNAVNSTNTHEDADESELPF